MKLRWWVLGWVAAVFAGIAIARWWADGSVFIPAAAHPAPESPLPERQPAPPLQAAAKPAPAV